MTPEEEREHNDFMAKVNAFLEHLKAKSGMHQPAPDDLVEAMHEVDPETGEFVYYSQDATTSMAGIYPTVSTTTGFHLDSVPVSPPAVRADTKRVPNNLRDMVEGKK